ncbi:MAG: hypothetical protein JNJ73_03200 [Hyphomonadaceae bacterium]|nr:hypothetical protein [Hyphomonadaceae bacterium]
MGATEWQRMWMPVALLAIASCGILGLAFLLRTEDATPARDGAVVAAPVERSYLSYVDAHFSRAVRVVDGGAMVQSRELVGEEEQPREVGLVRFVPSGSVYFMSACSPSSLEATFIIDEGITPIKVIEESATDRQALDVPAHDAAAQRLGEALCAHVTRRLSALGMRERAIEDAYRVTRVLRRGG